MSIFKKIILFLGDIIILYASLVLMIIFRYKPTDFTYQFQTHFLPFSLIFIIWLVIFYLADLYRQQSLQKPEIILKGLITAVVINGIISTIVFYLFGTTIFQLTPKTNLLIFGVIFLAFDFLFRNALRKTFTLKALDTVIIGDSKLINETINYLKENPQTGYRIIKKFNKFSPEVFENILKEIELGGIQNIVIHPHFSQQTRNAHLLYQLLSKKVNIVNFWNFYETIFEKIPLEELPESWFIENIKIHTVFYDTAKRLLDILLALICLMIFFAPAIVIALFIKLTSKGPIIYKQKRIGKNGKVFTLYKFRTMYSNVNGPYWTTTDDKRITPFGKILRFTHLDEIPQLLNIIYGDISFIGPRPERVELAEKYRQFPHYEIRHIIKPGLTGWAQINYRPSASYQEAFEKLCYDIYYVKNRSIFLDIMIILKTIRYLFTAYNK